MEKPYRRHIIIPSRVFLHVLKLVWRGSLNTAEWSNTYLCTHVTSLRILPFVFTDTFMHPHTPKCTHIKHKQPPLCIILMFEERSWLMKVADFRFSVLFWIFFWTFSDLNWPCEYIWEDREEERERERWGSCVWGNVFYVLNAWYICMCIHHRSLS